MIRDGSGRKFSPLIHTMQNEPQSIEVEVVEIDGIAPPTRVEPSHETPRNSRGAAGAQWQDWQKWQGRVRKLDSRWWPLWVILGIIALFLILTVGVVVGVLVLIYRIITGFFRALMR